MKSKKAASIPIESLPDDEELPEGWEQVHLSEVSELISGAGFPEKFQGQQDLQYPFFKVGNLADVKSGDFLLHSAHSVDEKIVKELHARIISPNSIIFAKIGMAIRLNRRRMIGVPSCIDNNMMAAVPNKRIIPKYLLRFLETVELMPLTQTTTVPSLRKTDIEMIKVPLPSLSEQQRIVARVEAILTQVNAARDRLNRVPLIMKKFRQAVLAAACSGRLTEGWREENCHIISSTESLNTFFRSELDDSSLKIIQKRTKDAQPIPDFEWSFEIPESWCWATLEKLAAIEKYSITDGPFGSNLKTEHYSQSGPRVIRLQNIGDGFFIDVKTHISQSHFDTLHKHEIFPGDIAIGLLGDPIPRSCIIPDGIGPAIVKADCTRFKPNPKLALTEFLSYAINEPELRSQATESVHGVARPRLNLTQIKNFSVPLPPLAEQHEIVRRVGLLYERADAFDQEFVAAGQRCERLTQAVLAKAFKGELVETKEKVTCSK